MKKGDIILTIGVFLIVLSLGIILINLYYYMGFGPKITGKASAVGVVSLFVLPSGEVMNLSTGWNFISFYTIMPNYTLEKVLEPIAGDYMYLQEWNSTKQDFNIWSVGGQKDFDMFNINKSYFIFMLRDRQLPFYGDLFQNWSIDFVQGWETPDYIYEYSSNVTGNSFYNVTFHYIQKWDVPTQEFMAYSPQSSSNPFSKILPNEGYLIRSEGGKLVYVRA